MPAGRPPYYNTIEELEAVIAEYWKYIQGEFKEDRKVDGKTGEIWIERICIRPPEHPSVTGLALYLGFTTRQGLLNYEEKEEFVDAIKKAKLKVEFAYEQALYGRNQAGPIFALKNFGWSDKQEIDQKTEHSGSIAITWQEPDVSSGQDQGTASEL